MVLKIRSVQLIQVVSQFPKENSHLIGSIILVGGKLNSISEAHADGYCEGIKALKYLSVKSQL